MNRYHYQQFDFLKTGFFVKFCIEAIAHWSQLWPWNIFKKNHVEIVQITFWTVFKFHLHIKLGILSFFVLSNLNIGFLRFLCKSISTQWKGINGPTVFIKLSLEKFISLTYWNSTRSYRPTIILHATYICAEIKSFFFFKIWFWCNLSVTV